MSTPKWPRASARSCLFLNKDTLSLPLRAPPLDRGEPPVERLGDATGVGSAALRQFRAAATTTADSLAGVLEQLTGIERHTGGASEDEGALLGGNAEEGHRALMTGEALGQPFHRRDVTVGEHAAHDAPRADH